MKEVFKMKVLQNGNDLNTQKKSGFEGKFIIAFFQ